MDVVRVLDGVAQTRLDGLCRGNPVVSALVVGVGRNPVEDRNLVDGQGVTRVDALGVSRYGAQVPQFVLDGVLVFLPSLGVGALVDIAGRLVDIGLCLCRIV